MAFRICCSCNNAGIFLRRYDTSTGDTLWEVDRGHDWSWQYGAEILGGWYVPKKITLNKFVKHAPGSWTRGALAGNVAEDVWVVTVDADTGAILTDVKLPGVFAVNTVVFGKTIPNALHVPSKVTMLSSGSALLSHHVFPSIELIDFTDNLAAKSYILHPHTNGDGTVTLTTTAAESLVLDFDTDAATAETAILALSNVSSATVTGGPWPLAALEVDIVWSTGTADFTAIAASTSVSGASTAAVASEYDTATGERLSYVTRSFGLGTGVTALKLDTTNPAAIPTVATAPRDTATAHASTSSDGVLFLGGGVYPTMEHWTAGFPWTRNWVKYINGTPDPGSSLASGSLSNVENDTVVVTFNSATTNKQYRYVACASGTISDVGIVPTPAGGNELSDVGGGFLAGVVLADGDESDLTFVYSSRNLSNRGGFVTEEGDTCFPHTAGANMSIGSVTDTTSPNDPTDSALFTRTAVPVWSDGLKPYGVASGSFLSVGSGLTPQSIDDDLISKCYFGFTESAPGRSGWAYKWHFQMQETLSFSSGEFRMKFQWDSGGFTFIYSDWYDYATASQAALSADLDTIMGPPQVHWDALVDPPLVQVASIVPGNSWPAAAPADKDFRAPLEIGLEIKFTVDKIASSDTYIDPTKRFVFTSLGYITFEFRNMVRTADTSDFALYPRSQDSDPTWGRAWKPKTGVQSFPQRGWIKDGFVVACGSESRNELPRP